MKKISLLLAIVAMLLSGCETANVNDPLNDIIEQPPKLPEVEEGDNICDRMDDMEFIAYCYQNFDANQDGVFSLAEAETVRMVDIREKNIFSVKGIEYFKNLNSLDVSDTPLLELDLRHNKNLTDVKCQNCTQLKKVLLPNIEYICDSAFYGCEALAEIIIPKGVKEVGSSAFYGCSNLTSLTISDSVTSIGDKAFYGCDNLTSLNITDLSAWCKVTFSNYYSNPLHCGAEFSLNGDKLTSLIIPSNITNIKPYAFYGCEQLTDVTIHKDITEIGTLAFNGCTNIGRVNISNLSSWCNIIFSNDVSNPLYYGAELYLNNSEVTDLTTPDDIRQIRAYAFNGCCSLKRVTISEPITSIGLRSFYNTSIEKVYFLGNNPPAMSDEAFYINTYNNPIFYVPDGQYATYLSCGWRTEYKAWISSEESAGLSSYKIEYTSDKRIYPKEQAFGYAVLVSHTYYDGKGVLLFDREVETIGSEAFLNCSELTSIKIPDSVTSIGECAFLNCTSLARVDITDLSAWCKIDFEFAANPLINGGKLYINNIEATKITIPSDITEIKQYTFFGCTSLTSVTIPGSITSIGDGSFMNCTALTSITIPNGVTLIGYNAFCGCSSLSSATIPDSVIEIGYSAFSDCTSLASVTIPDSVTTIRDKAFYNCSGITSVTIGKGVTSIGKEAFYGCMGELIFNSKIIENGSASNNPSVTWLNGAKFTKLTIGDNITKIGEYIFYRCDLLTSVTIGNSVTSIGNSSFNGCTSLTSVTIPDSVTSIGSYAFYGCRELKSVIIGKGVTSIGRSAFNNCTSLTNVYCKPTVPPAIYYAEASHSESFYSFPFNSGMKIYVPRSSYNAYMSYEYTSDGWVSQYNWYEYKSYIVAYDF